MTGDHAGIVCQRGVQQLRLSHQPAIMIQRELLHIRKTAALRIIRREGGARRRQGR
ncbi:hypothetical protein D3C87_2034980 [compost metagenome]